MVTLKVWRKIWGDCELNDTCPNEEGKFVLNRISYDEWVERAATNGV